MNRPDIFPWMLTFENLFKKTAFLEDMKEMFQCLEKAYNYPVDIEFTANFLSESDYKVNLLQCRPFQVKKGITTIEMPKNLKEEDIILRSQGPIIGQSTIRTIDRVIYVVPEKYGTMSMSDRCSVARLIGELANSDGGEKKIMIIGPGRWGTRMPSLGIPVTFNEIKNVSIICELDKMHKGLTPDVSLGTHFFNDLVEMEIIYMAVFPDKKGYIVNEELLMNAPNRLRELAPDARSWADSILVIDIKEIDGKQKAYVNINSITQEGVIFLSKK